MSKPSRQRPSGPDEPLTRYRADLASRQAWRLTQRPALCCECGMVRSTTATGALRRDVAGRPDQPVAARCIVIRKCAACRTRTPHAYLLVNGRADHVELAQPYPTLDEATEAHLFEVERDEAESGGITVTDQVSDRILVTVSQRLDDCVWTVHLNPDGASKRRRLGLRTAMRAIRDARDQTWFVEVADPVYDLPAVRFAVFGVPTET